MGRVKEEWIRQQELEPMYEWIEGNFGIDASEEGSEEWNEAVRAYEEHRREQETYWQGEYDYYISLTLKDADSIFQKDLIELKSMLGIAGDGESNKTYLKMVYAHAVTILEVYLEDVAKSLIMSSEEYLSNTIKNVRPFCNTPFRLSDWTFAKLKS